MVTARAWTIKGVSDRTRDAVYEVTRATGLTVGEWVDRALAKAAEEVKARIEELHRAGRSAYAISKELGVSYKTVQARVKTLAAGNHES